MKKKGEPEFVQEAYERKGIRPFGLGQIYVQKFEEHFEFYELVTVEIWYKKEIKQIRDKHTNFERVMTRFLRTNFIIVYEYTDINDHFAIKMHAVNVIFSMERGAYLMYDSNEEEVHECT